MLYRTPTQDFVWRKVGEIGRGSFASVFKAQVEGKVTFKLLNNNSLNRRQTETYQTKQTQNKQTKKKKKKKREITLLSSSSPFQQLLINQTLRKQKKKEVK